MANNNILEAVKTVAENIEKTSDRTFSAVVYEKDLDGKYKIPYEGRLRSVANGTGISLEVGQLVWVKIPNGKLRDMHICGIRKSENAGKDTGTLEDVAAIKKEITNIKNDLSQCIVDENYVHTDNNYTTEEKESVGTIKDKVDKVVGKGLSTNDFTDELKRNYDTAYSQSHVHNNKEILDTTSASYSVSEQEKLGSIENGAQKNTITGVKGSAETVYRTGDINITKANIGLGDAENTADKDKPVSTAQQKAIDEAYANSNKYTDQKIADLIDGAPETLDTLKEISDAISASKSVEEALNKAIGTKADQTELDAHTGNDTIHITSTERTNWNDANSKKHTHSNKSVLDGISASNITNWNKVSDKIDKTGDLSNATVTFTTATDRVNLTTGEKISTAFGKIAKWFSSLKSIAFSGSYKDLSDTPTLGTAAAKDVAASGNASTTQVVMGNDTRLTDARKASDVYSWAKQASKPSYTASEVGAAAANHTHSNYMSSTHEVVSSSEPTSQAVGDYWIKRIN